MVLFLYPAVRLMSTLHAPRTRAAWSRTRRVGIFSFAACSVGATYWWFFVPPSNTDEVIDDSLKLINSNDEVVAELGTPIKLVLPGNDLAKPNFHRFMATPSSLHLRTQFALHGPRNRAIVHLEITEKQAVSWLSSNWTYVYLIVEPPGACGPIYIIDRRPSQ